MYFKRVLGVLDMSKRELLVLKMTFSIDAVSVEEQVMNDFKIGDCE